MKKEINSNNEKLVNKVSEILTKFKDDPKKFENIFTELFEKDFDVHYCHGIKNNKTNKVPKPCCR